MCDSADLCTLADWTIQPNKIFPHKTGIYNELTADCLIRIPPWLLVQIYKQQSGCRAGLPFSSNKSNMECVRSRGQDITLGVGVRTKETAVSDQFENGAKKNEPQLQACGTTVGRPSVVQVERPPVYFLTRGTSAPL
ncbi:unnamed protein product [Calicophoron daubneyi]|uniref:Uncharacterized protein n=1 Tax=Calicophoron daubneyi TaxID=300641 RepID=A0AAV2U038_CALDB